MGQRIGKWIVTDADYPKFLDLMHDYLFVKRGRPMAFVEQPRRGEPKPLLIDLDFKYSAETSLVRAFTLEQIKSFCQLLVEGLNIFFGVQDYEEMRFFVTLRPAPYASGGARKDGIHILCPDIALSDEKQKVLRNWVLSQDGIAACFPETGYTNEPADIYDESMVRKQGWIFYGESKPNIPPYKLAAVFTYSGQNDEWEEEAVETYTPKQLLYLLSVRHEIPEDVNTVKEEAAQLFDEMKNWHEDEVAAPAAQEEGEGAIQTAQANTMLEALQALYPSAAPTDDERGLIRRLVMECLPAEYYDKYDKWIRVGWCLHNIDPSEESFQLWMDFSAQSSKASGNDKAQLRREWFHGWRKDGDGPRLTERSLRKWAKDANPEKYKEILSEYIGEYVRQEVDATHHHVAKLMKKIYGQNYIASVGAKTTEWYKYDEIANMWKKLNQGIELRMKICTEVAKSITDATSKLFADAGAAPNNDTRELLQNKAKSLLKVVTGLYSSAFGDSVMKMAVHQFYEEDFQNKLNINPFLFGCKNGVLELRAPGADGRDHVIFRQGRPEDYVSFY
jgi:hypothetical protein